jgi:hypothetical protein
MKHKHAELIKAWADGAEIQQYKPHLDEWHDTSPYPVWDARVSYRIKPEPKPDVVLYSLVGELMSGIGAVVSSARSNMVTKYKHSNVKYIFDGETGELKSAEVVK